MYRTAGVLRMRLAVAPVHVSRAAYRIYLYLGSSMQHRIRQLQAHTQMHFYIQNCRSFNTCTPSSSSKPSPHSGHWGVASFLIISSAHDLQSLWPQAACTGSLKSSLQLTQWNWSTATSPLKMLFGNFIPGIFSRPWFHWFVAKCRRTRYLA